MVMPRRFSEPGDEQEPVVPRKGRPNSFFQMWTGRSNLPEQYKGTTIVPGLDVYDSPLPKGGAMLTEGTDGVCRKGAFRFSAPPSIRVRPGRVHNSTKRWDLNFPVRLFPEQAPGLDFCAPWSYEPYDFVPILVFHRKAGPFESQYIVDENVSVRTMK